MLQHTFLKDWTQKLRECLCYWFTDISSHKQYSWSHISSGTVWQPTDFKSWFDMFTAWWRHITQYLASTQAMHRYFWLVLADIFVVWQFLLQKCILCAMLPYPLLTAWLRSEKYMWFMLSAADSLENVCYKNDCRQWKSREGKNPWQLYLPAGLQTRSLLRRSRPLPGNLGTT